MQALWDAGFDRHSADGLHIPEPIAFVPEMSLLLQEEVPEHTVKQLIRAEGSVPINFQTISKSDSSVVLQIILSSSNLRCFILESSPIKVAAWK